MRFILKINQLDKGISVLYIVIFLLLPIKSSSGSQDEAKDLTLGYLQTKVIVGSSAQILLKHKTTVTLLNYCATKFTHLSQSAISASHDWQQKHAPYIIKAKAITQYVANSIERHDSSFAAEKFQLKIDAQVYDNTQKIKLEMTNKNRKQQHYVCNRLILSTAIGEWDMNKKIPQHVQRVLQFELKK